MLRSLPAADRALLARSAAWLVRCRVALWTRPYADVRGRVIAWGDRRVDAGAAPGRVAWAVTHAARIVPGASCLTQALAADVLLRRAGERPELCFGVALGAGDFEAHAWLELDGRVLVGEAGLDRFTPLATSIVASERAPVDSPEP
jgi:hypothetical protein